MVLSLTYAEEEEHCLSPNSNYIHLMSFVCIISSPGNAGWWKKGLGKHREKTDPICVCWQVTHHPDCSEGDWTNSVTLRTVAILSGNSRSLHWKKRNHLKSHTVFSKMWTQTHCLMYLWWCSTVEKVFPFLFTTSIWFQVFMKRKSSN